MKRLISIVFSLAIASSALWAQNDTTKVLLIGNSFTYGNNSWDMLEQIAKSNGKLISIEHSCQPGYAFADHLGCQATTDAILKGGYDFAILQDQSQTPAKYAKDPIGNSKFRSNFITLTNRIFGWSPAVKIIVECSWAYPAEYWGGFGSESEFNYFLQNGTRLYSEVVLGKVSPVGRAFSDIRATRPEIELLDSDGQHPSLAGTYLKCCVNYLVLFGGNFDIFTENCGLDPMVAKNLRAAALKAVQE